MGDMSREPSMEDILSSIRRVIARDEAPGAVREVRAPASEDVLELHDEEDEAEGAAPVAGEEELVSAASADAARQSLEALTAAVTPAVAAAVSAPAATARTMEDVVLDALRPMLKDWLDTNLPPLVEAMVAKEISRITGKKF
ncbi:DUF2497 domain-containing protein [Sphingopyxis sp. OPL5]|uniref:DUF2497 domain-containing protein n=1 Tax=Sphingopyxis sp. OPL5 TaxID=2486273 RepID=UPI00164CFD35|nr:DUF2497 domain-containing protein [Sphingopyxis sp. OPL5]QNO29026.1 DUF2497 domain-containing protein [Sphingopyxis sp. OPL5]